MPKTPKQILIADGRRGAKAPVAKGAPLRSKPGPVRTVGGRITYAGIDQGENVRQRRDWYGEGQ